MVDGVRVHELQRLVPVPRHVPPGQLALLLGGDPGPPEVALLQHRVLELRHVPCRVDAWVAGLQVLVADDAGVRLQPGRRREVGVPDVPDGHPHDVDGVGVLPGLDAHRPVPGVRHRVGLLPTPQVDAVAPHRLVHDGGTVLIEHGRPPVLLPDEVPGLRVGGGEGPGQVEAEEAAADDCCRIGGAEVVAEQPPVAVQRPQVVDVVDAVFHR